VCFSLGYYVESLGYFRRAVAVDRSFLKARENLDNVCSRLVERWHFRMLNDAVRNSAFYRAISLAVDSLEPATSGGELVVLDIGTGSGILRYAIIDTVVCVCVFMLASLASSSCGFDSRPGVIKTPKSTQPSIPLE